jgi:cryptochrome
LQVQKHPGKICELRPIFVLDPWFVKHMEVGPNRWRFLQQSLADLDKNLRSIGSRLYVIRGKPEEIFPKLFKSWSVKCLTFEQDIEPYSRERDEAVEKLAKEAGVKVVQKVSHTLYNPAKVINANLGKAPMTYQKFVSVAEGLGPPPKAISAPTEVPAGYSKLHEGSLKIPEEEDVFGNIDAPLLSDFGLDEGSLEPCLFPGGETEALKRMEQNLARKVNKT